MATGKLYIGKNIRDLRLTHKATQAQFADRIGISVSYLNQIENNQRPVSASVLLTLAEKFKLDLSEIDTSESSRLLSALTEALTDPIFSAFSPSQYEIKLVAQNAPEIAHSLIAGHQAYRHKSEQLASMDDTLGRTTEMSGSTPYEEVRDFFHFVDNYVHEVDMEAEALAARLGIGDGDPAAILTAYAEKQFGIRIVRGARNEGIIRHFDAKARILALSPDLSPATQSFQIALQIAQMSIGDLVERTVQSTSFRTPEAREICKIGLHNYFAGALMLPYRIFAEAARELRHDIDLLSVRFGASLEQVCHRLSTLQRKGEKGVPIFFAKVDRAGNITKRHSAAKLQFARYGAACPLWNVHRAFEQGGEINRQLAETPDGVRYLCLSIMITKGERGFRGLRQHYALALGCEISYADNFVYADDMDLGNQSSYDPIGISCRICERSDCPSRAVPPLKGHIEIAHNIRNILPYSLK